MDKLKKILKPGHKSAADDETLYGTSDPLNHPAGSNDPQLHSTQKAYEDTGLARQILNPGGAKYDETRFGTTATTASEAHEPTDPTALSSTTAPTTGTQPESLAPPHTSTRLGDDGDSTVSIKSGVPGVPQTTSTTSQIPPNQHTTYGKDAALTESAALAGGTAPGLRDDQSALADEVVPGISTHGDHHEGYAHVQGTTTARKFSLGSSKRPENLSTSTGTSQPAGAIREEIAPTASSQPTNYSRDAAAAGAAGALGLGGYDTSKNAKPAQQPATYQPTGTVSANPAALAAARAAAGQQPSSKSATDSYASVPYHAPGPHKTDAANRLDPAVDTVALDAARKAPGAASQDEPRTGAGFGIDSGARDAAREAPEAAARDEKSSNFGRNAALAGAGAAVAGGAYAAEKGHEGRDLNTVPTDTGPAPRTIGPHKSDVLNVLDPRVKPEPALQKSSLKDTAQASSGPSVGAIDAPVSDANKVNDSRAQPEAETQATQGHDRALGAAGLGAGAAALGGAAVAAHESDKSTPAQTQPQSTAPEPKRAESYQDHGPLSDLHQGSGEKWSGWKNPYSAAAVDPRLDDMPGAYPETPGDERPQPGLRQQSSSKLGTTGAAGLAGAGAGVGAYEASKSHDTSEDKKPATSVAPQPDTASNIGTAVTSDKAIPSPTHHEFVKGAGVADVSESQEEGEMDKEHHYGRDALVAGGVGAAGVGTYEAAKQLEQSKGPLSNKDIYGEDALKPKPVQQQAVQSASQESSKPSTAASPIFFEDKSKKSPPGQATAKPESHDGRYGRDSVFAGGAVGSGLAAAETPKKDTLHEGDKVPTSTKEIYGEEAVKPKRVQQEAPETTAEDHHYGRDAALAGGAGAVGLGAYEASKPDSVQQEGKVPTSNKEIYGEEAVTPKPVQQPTSAASGDGHHTGRDTALAAGAGAAGVGAYEASKPTGSQQTSPPAHLRAAHNIYPPELFQSHPQQPTTAATAGGVGGDSATGQVEPAQQGHHYGRDAAIAGGAAGIAGAGAYAATRKDDPAQPQTAPAAQHTQEQPPSSLGIASTTGAPFKTASENSKAFQQPSASSKFEDPRQAPQPPVSQADQTQHHYGRDAALAGGATAAGVGAYDYAPKPTEAQRDPVAALQSGITRGYDDQRAAPHSGAQNFDPVRGGTLDEDGVSHPHDHSHPAYVPDTQVEQPQVHRNGRDAAVAAAAGIAGAGAGAGYAADHHDSQPHEQEKFNPMNPTGAPAGLFHHHHQDQQDHHAGRDAAVAGGAGTAAAGHPAQLQTAGHHHTPSASSSKYSDENKTPDSPTSSKRKHKILTFLNKKEDKDSSPRSSLDKSHGSKESNLTHDPATEKQQQQGALHGLGGPEGHEFQGLGPNNENSSAGVGRSPSVKNVDGHNKLHKEPPKKWIEEHLGGQQDGSGEAPPSFN